MADSYSDKRIAVLGAGVIGLSTAICIQQNLPGIQVSIFADRFTNETLSSGAGGIYRPDITIDHDSKKLKKWCNDSLRYFYDVLKSDEASGAGVQEVSGYHLSSTENQNLHNPLLKEMQVKYRNLSAEELCLFPSYFKNGVFYKTIIVDCRYYLPWLMKKFEENGGIIIKKHIPKLSEIPGTFELVVNCTGLGAKKLLNDPFLVPIRGQTIKVRAPWIKHFYYGDEVYIAPGLDYVTLGGIKEYGSWNMDVNQYQKNFIWDKCVELVPSLQHAEVIHDWVGLRPHRSTVCVEANIIQCCGKYFKVVNNYGHGAYGVTLSWGTALQAAELTKKLLQNSSVLLSRL